MFGIQGKLSAEQTLQVITEVQSNPHWGAVPAKAKDQILEELYCDYIDHVVDEFSKKIAPPKVKSRKPRVVKKSKSKKEETEKKDS